MQHFVEVSIHEQQTSPYMNSNVVLLTEEEYKNLVPKVSEDTIKSAKIGYEFLSELADKLNVHLQIQMAVGSFGLLLDAVGAYKDEDPKDIVEEKR